MPTTPLWKLRRLAPRAKRVQTRRAAEAPVIAAFESTLHPKADAFIEAYDAAALYEARWLTEMREGKGAIAALVKAVRVWLPLLTRDVPGFAAGSFADKPDVPDDVLEDAERMISVIESFVGADSKPLAFQAVALAALNPAFEAAQKEWAEAEAADSTYQQLLKTNRETAAAFDIELQTFRRALGTSFSRSDKDFQKLRTERAAHQDEEDDPNAPKPAVQPAPATPSTPPPAP